MALRVYNTLSRTVEDFTPIKKGEVSVYICGLTTYDFMHIGHARTYIAFDSILRYLKYRGFDVKYLQNLTDIDDKIIKRAKEKGVDPLELSKEFSEKSLEDQESLGLLLADKYPKVSEHVKEIISAVEKLVEKKSAYVAGGNVYFSVLDFPNYGKLSNQNIEQLNQHRIDPDPNKKSPLDFALWKSVPEGELGFESPWGYGRPGWHMECSVMSTKYLGEQFDIHGGALDLIFPHHENEIAQSESLTGEKPFVKYWLHTGFLQSSGEKMSKSLGNILPVREFLEKYSAEAFRLFVLQTHYRSPIDYSTENVVQAEAAVKRLKTFRKNLELASLDASGKGSEILKASEKLSQDFTSAMDDDFNTPRAIGALFDAVRKTNTLLDDKKESKDSLKKMIVVFDELTSVLGFDFTPKEKEQVPPEITKLVDERNKARAEKNWSEADKIRDLLRERGYNITDQSDGTTLVEKS